MMKLDRMVGGHSDTDLPSVFFTYRLEDREEHLSPQEVRAASHLGQLYPFLGSNGVPQHFKHTSQAVNEGLSEGLSEGLLRKPVEPAQSRAGRRSVLREKTGNYIVAAPGKENLQPARGGGGELAGVRKSSRRKVGAAEQDISGKDSDNNTQVRINDFSPPPSEKKNYLSGDRVILLLLLQILQTLLSLGTDIKTCSDGFHDMKERLLHVETSLTLNIQDLHTQYEVWGYLMIVPV